MKKQIMAIVFPQIRRDFARSGENLTGFDEIQPDLVKISPDLREISPKSGFLRRILKIYCRILEILPEAGKLSVSSGFSDFRGGKPKPTRRNWFLVVKTRRRPAGVVGLAGFRWIRSVLRVGQVTGSIWTALPVALFTLTLYIRLRMKRVVLELQIIS